MSTTRLVLVRKALVNKHIFLGGSGGPTASAAVVLRREERVFLVHRERGGGKEVLNLFQ